MAYSSRDFNVSCGRETAMVGQLWLLYVLDPNTGCFVAFITVMPLMRQNEWQYKLLGPEIEQERNRLESWYS